MWLVFSRFGSIHVQICGLVSSLMSSGQKWIFPCNLLQMRVVCLDFRWGNTTASKPLGLWMCSIWTAAVTRIWLYPNSTTRQNLQQMGGLLINTGTSKSSESLCSTASYRPDVAVDLWRWTSCRNKKDLPKVSPRFHKYIQRVGFQMWHQTPHQNFHYWSNA